MDATNAIMHMRPVLLALTCVLALGCVGSLEQDNCRQLRALAFSSVLPGRPREQAALAVRRRRPLELAGCGGLRKGRWSGRRVVGLAAHALRRGDEEGTDAALLEAAQDGDTARVQRALEGGASIAATNDWGTTCLHLSVKGGHAEVICQSACVLGLRAVPLMPSQNTRWLAYSSRRALTPIAPRFRHPILKSTLTYLLSCVH